MVVLSERYRMKHLPEILLTVWIFLITRCDAGKKVFCYYSSFAQNRQGVGKFLPENIDPFLCTHIIFAFVDIHPDGTELMSFNGNDIGPSGLYARTNALKQKNPALKVLLAVGGWQIGSKPFIPIMQDEDVMRRWIKNVVKNLRKYNFDGFDMDWEFPATRGSPPEDKYKYTKLMKNLYEEFAREARETGREKLILTMATAAGTYFINTSYESNKIIKYMDYMLLMTYNYHGQWEKRTGHHSGLWKHRDDTPGEQSELHQEWSIDYWLNMGIPKEKLVVGLATYGMSFTLADPYQNGVHAPAIGGGRMGKYTKETGIMSYYEICENIQKNGWRTGWIDDQAVPYAYGDDQWVGFDSIDSIEIKAKNILKRDLAGAFVWSVEMDDFGGVCGDGKYPLLSTVTRVLKPYEGIVQPALAETKLSQSRLADVNLDISRHHDPQPESNQESQIETATSGSIFTRPPGLVGNRNVGSREKQPSSSTESHVTQGPLWTQRKTSEELMDMNTREANSPWGHSAKGKSMNDNSDSSLTSRKTSSGAEDANGGSTINCKILGSGLFSHPDDCTRFVMCLPGVWMDYPPHIMNCPSGTRFDEELKVCNHARQVDC